MDLANGAIDTFGGTGERQPTPDGAPLAGTPLNGPRTMAFDPTGELYLALREGNAIYRIAQIGRGPFIMSPGPANRATPATAGRPGWRGWRAQRDSRWSRGGLYVADTENHVIRAIDL